MALDDNLLLKVRLTVDNLCSHLVLGDDQVIGDGGQVAHFLITDHGASAKKQTFLKISQQPNTGLFIN